MSGPTKKKGPTVAAVAPQESKRNETGHCHGTTHAGQALRVIEGQQIADAFLARLHAQQADPDELAVLLSMLYGPTLRGFCRALEKAIGVRHE